MMRILRIFLLALLLSGCLSGQSDEKANPPKDEGMPPSEESPPDPGQGNVTPPLDTNATPALEMSLEDCQYLEAVRTNFPAALQPGEAPEGWENEIPLSDVGMEGWRCQKIHLGDFERGPLWFALDRHNKVTFPPGCSRDVHILSTFYMLHSFLVSDSEIASLLRKAYGMPVYYASINGTEEAQGPLISHDWTFAPETGAPSVVSVLDDGTAATDPIQGDRYFWEKGEGIVALEIITERTGPAFASRAATGTFSEPFLFAQVNDGDFAGDGAWYPSASASGHFTFYADKFCEDPV